MGCARQGAPVIRPSEPTIFDLNMPFFSIGRILYRYDIGLLALHSATIDMRSRDSTGNIPGPNASMLPDPKFDCIFLQSLRGADFRWSR